MGGASWLAATCAAAAAVAVAAAAGLEGTANHAPTPMPPHLRLHTCASTPTPHTPTPAHLRLHHAHTPTPPPPPPHTYAPPRPTTQAHLARHLFPRPHRLCSKMPSSQTAFVHTACAPTLPALLRHQHSRKFQSTSRPTSNTQALPPKSHTRRKTRTRAPHTCRTRSPSPAPPLISKPATHPHPTSPTPTHKKHAPAAPTPVELALRVEAHRHCALQELVSLHDRREQRRWARHPAHLPRRKRKRLSGRAEPNGSAAHAGQRARRHVRCAGEHQVFVHLVAEADGVVRLAQRRHHRKLLLLSLIHI
eukprot:365662-Chlamydomonas_euryale.AAC.1